MTEIIVEGLEFYAFHGVSVAEREVGHRLRLDIHATVLETASHSDNVHETVDYGALAGAAVEAARLSQNRTLEKTLTEIADCLLNQFLRIETLRMRLVKVAPPVPFSIVSVGIEKIFSR